MAAVALSHTQMSQSTSNLMVSGTTRPAFVRPVASNMQGVRRGNVVMQAQFPGSEEEADVPVMEVAVSATAMGMAADAAETGTKIYPVSQEGQRSLAIVISSSQAPQRPP